MMTVIRVTLWLVLARKKITEQHLVHSRMGQPAKPHGRAKPQHTRYKARAACNTATGCCCRWPHKPAKICLIS
jgi:hypothetical protein